MLKNKCVGVLSAETEVLISVRRKVEKAVSQMNPEGSGSFVRDIEGDKNEGHIIHRDKSRFPGLDLKRGGCMEMACR